MKRYLLDTNAVSDLMANRYEFRGQAKNIRSRGCILGTCEPVVAELHFGVENSQLRQENLQKLNITLKQLRCWPLDRLASREFGRISANLQQVGISIGMIDRLIAAIALSIGNCILVSADIDLFRVPGLVVEN